VDLLTDLDAFSLEHRRCSDLDGGADGPVVWIACDCGASMARRVNEDDHVQSMIENQWGAANKHGSIRLGLNDVVQRLLDRLPYSDGSGRRRFVAGGIVVIGLVLSGIVTEGIRDLAPPLLGVNAEMLFRSPLLILSVMLVVYALGTVVELLGDIFLVRAASGIPLVFQLSVWEFQATRQ
jgi:hypothetical protein